jgi:dihydroxyacetone kinase-like protein
MASADEIVDEMMKPILDDADLGNGDEVAVLMNGLGATPLEEQYIAYKRVHDILTSRGIGIFHVYAGEFATSMEMAGLSISVFKLDEELKRLLSKPAYTPFFSQPQL